MGTDIIPMLQMRKHKFPQLGMVEQDLHTGRLGSVCKLFTTLLVTSL